MSARTRMGSMLPRIGVFVVLCAIAVGAESSGAASSSSVVGATVPSASWVDSTGCATGTSNVTDLGAVTPGSSVVTGLDCVVKFGSSNDTSMLRAYQRDGGGLAMVAGPATGELVHWPFSNAANDIAGTDQPLTLGTAPNDPSYVAGQAAYGQALDLDGNDHASSTHATFDFSGDTSISMWFRGTSNSAFAWNTMLTKTPGGSCSYPACPYVLEWRTHSTASSADDDIQFQLSDTGCTCLRTVDAQNVGSTYLDGQWHHLAVTIDVGGTMRLYLDGVPTASVPPVTGPLVVAATTFRIGADSAAGNASFTGAIDELRVTSTARTASDIRAEYAGRISDYADPADDWDSAGATESLFAACLRSVAGGATSGGTAWTEGPGNACTAADGAHWNAIPASSPGTKVAYVSAPDAQGDVPDPDPVANLRFGLRVPASQAPGTYLAPITFDVVAPNS